MPSAPHIQDPPAGRLDWTIHHMTDAMLRFRRLCDLILRGVPNQSRSQFAPCGSRKSKAQEEVGFASAGRMRGIKQVTSDLPLGNGLRLKPDILMDPYLHG